MGRGTKNLVESPQNRSSYQHDHNHALFKHSLQGKPELKGLLQASQGVVMVAASVEVERAVSLILVQIL